MKLKCLGTRWYNVKREGAAEPASERHARSFFFFQAFNPSRFPPSSTMGGAPSKSFEEASAEIAASTAPLKITVEFCGK